MQLCNSQHTQQQQTVTAPTLPIAILEKSVKTIIINLYYYKSIELGMLFLRLIVVFCRMNSFKIEKQWPTKDCLTVRLYFFFMMGSLWVIITSVTHLDKALRIIRFLLRSEERDLFFLYHRTLPLTIPRLTFNHHSDVLKNGVLARLTSSSGVRKAKWEMQINLPDLLGSNVSLAYGWQRNRAPQSTTNHSAIDDRGHFQHTGLHLQMKWAFQIHMAAVGNLPTTLRDDWVYLMQGNVPCKSIH